MFSFRSKTEEVLTSGSRDHRRPVLGRGFESNIKGLHIVGDLAGAPVIKLAMAQAVELVDHLASLPEMREPSKDECLLDILVIGAGAAGLNAALEAQDRGFSCVVLEKGQIANTIEHFPEGKWVYAEPDSTTPKGKLWLDGARKEDLIERWNAIVRDNDLDVRTGEPLVHLESQKDGIFIARSPKAEYRAKKVVLATGQRGNPRKLGVSGEDLAQVYHRLYSPTKYRDEKVLVVGGGNSAVEAALTLSERNKVWLSYRKEEFARIFKDNRRLLEEAVAAGRVELLMQSQVKEFRPGEVELEVAGQDSKTIAIDHAFVLIGAELPVAFLKSLGIRLENEWTGKALPALALTILSFLGLWFAGILFDVAAPLGLSIGSTGGGLGAGLAAAALLGLLVRGCRGDRWSWLGLSFFAWYSIYGIKVGKGSEFWPYTGWGYESLSFFERPWAFWYTVLYTALMTVFGIGALKRWGLERKDRFQIFRFTSLISFQWIFFFLVPEFLFQWAVAEQWVGEALASDPQFADQAWRSYGLIYAWPLFFFTFFYDPHQIWVVWGVFLTFVIIPILVLFQGKRYCSWICGCGGLAETFGDRWRHLAPKGRGSIKLEVMGTWVLLAAFLVTLVMLLRDVIGLYRTADFSLYVYRILIDVWLVGILPVTVYPFMGGKVWCRYWCPLAKLMQAMSKFYSKLGISRFSIEANDKCIGCNECSRNCQVGIDVMQYALKQETLDNSTSSCIGCGVCVTVCPMDTLSFGSQESAAEVK
ncbi:MAG: NAD(P)-binding domain-containing protein [Planctomycetota bacterium]|jgi:thioredoxin reductase/polyferredoxin